MGHRPAQGIGHRPNRAYLTTLENRYSNPKWVVKYADKLGRGNPTLGCPGGRGRQRKALPLQVFTNDLGLLYIESLIFNGLFIKFCALTLGKNTVL
jgi:hypothetical protein